MLSAEVNVVDVLVYEKGTPEDILSWQRIKELVEAQATSTNEQSAPCTNSYHTTYPCDLTECPACHKVF